MVSLPLDLATPSASYRQDDREKALRLHAEAAEALAPAGARGHLAASGDIQEALDSLREREFRAGRYFPAMLDLTFSLRDPPPGPGARHASIAAAREAAAEDGTKSILDFERVSLEPARDTITPLDPDMIDLCLGSVTPARETLEDSLSCLLKRSTGAKDAICSFMRTAGPRSFCSWACRSIEHLEAQSDGSRRFDFPRASAASDALRLGGRFSAWRSMNVRCGK